MPSLAQFKDRVRALKAETLALYFAARHPQTPWYAKLLVGGIVAYALSPIDLIPDFVPILGYVDDLLLLPVGIALALKLIPPAVMVECRAKATQRIKDGEPVSRVAAAVIIILWIVVTALGIWWAYDALA